MDSFGSRLLSLLLLGQAAAVQGGEIGRRQATSKFCDPGFSSVCLSQFTSSPSNIAFRIAIPDESTASFDTLLQIVAPASVGWAGIAWGGGMTNNPLTVAWPSGNGAIVSSRWATGHTVPGAYSGASYKTLSSSKNASHWQISVVCSGCSQWSGGSLKADGSSQLAWAMGTGAVPQPSNNASSFGYHSAKGRFSVDLSASKVSKDAFEAYQAFLSKGSEAAPASTPAPAPPAQTPSSQAPPPAASSSSPAPALPSPPAPTSEDWPPTTTTLTVTAAPPAVTAKPNSQGGDGDGEDEGDDGEGETVTITMGPIGGLPFRRPPFKGKGKRIRPPFRPPLRGPRT